jgi:hypothetical protein
MVTAYASKYLGMQTSLNHTELPSFDIMLDKKLKPWLLEVNHTPSFSADTPLDLHIKKCLILDTLNIVNVSSKARKVYTCALTRWH